LSLTKPLRWTVTVALTAAASIVGLSQPASAVTPVAAYTGPLYNLKTWDAGTPRVMAVKNASTSNGAALIQYTYSAGTPNNDRIVIEYESTATNLWRLKPQHTYSDDGNVHNDKCIAVQGNAYGNNIPIVNADCTYDGINNDVWERVIYTSDTYAWRRTGTQQCITTQGASTANGAALITYNCNGGDNAQWFLQ
jgi:ricin-type beta-trefoil lectin protein